MGEEAAFVATTSGSMQLWNQRMAHLHIDAIRQLARTEMVNGPTVELQRSF